MAFCVGLLSRSKMFSRFIQDAARNSSSTILMAEWYPIIWINHILFIHSSHDGHLDGFYFGATVNSAAMNIWVQVFRWTYFQYSGGTFQYSRSRTAGSYGNCFIFSALLSVFQRGCIIFIPLCNIWGFQSLHILTSSCYHLFYCGHPSRCEVVSRCGFHLNLPNNEWRHYK